MSRGALLLDGLMRSLALESVLETADRGGALSREQLRHVLALPHPLGAAVLADRRRVARCGDDATFPVTLRVRLPDHDPSHCGATDWTHAPDEVDGVAASEWQWIGAPPPDADVAWLAARVTAARAARPDLPVRAFTTDAVLSAAGRSGDSVEHAVHTLVDAGIAAFDWAPGSDDSALTLDVHRAAHAAGLRTLVALPYRRNRLDDTLLDRLEAIASLAAATRGVAAVVPLPDRTEGASPLHGTAGTEDVRVFALARLALDHAVSHITLDAHVLGHKLGGLLLSAGVCDVIGAQARSAWPAPTNDGPRPLNQDRVTRLLVEARRTPVRRDRAAP
jgi:FO synthase subunit 2